MVKGATVPWRTGQHGQSSSFLQASPTTEESSQLCRSIEAQFQQTLPNHNIGSARRASNGPYGGWYRKSIPNDDVWRMACIPLNRGKERSSPASSTVSRPRQPYGSSDIPAAHSCRAGTGSGRKTEEGLRTAASSDARWSRRGPQSGTASPMGGATPSPGASLDAPSARRSSQSGSTSMHPAREGRRSPGCSMHPKRPLPPGAPERFQPVYVLMTRSAPCKRLKVICAVMRNVWPCITRHQV